MRVAYVKTIGKYTPYNKETISLLHKSPARFHVEKVNSPNSKYIFLTTNRNIEKASHTFVVYHLLIDIVQFVWSSVQAGRQVIQFSKHCQFCV